VSEATKPVVAAVRGLAVGIGTTILLHCDLVYAADNTRFILPFVDLGLVPEAGSTYLLPLRLGHVRAAELLLLAKPFDALRALELGLVNEVLPAEQLMATAQAAAEALAEKPQAALGATKQLLKHAAHAPTGRAIADEVLAFVEQLKSEDTKARMQAILNKRKA
jgi:enoyl-CoA hydratase/carnithine racemase